MKTKDKIEKEVELTLSVLDKVKKAKVKPFFYERLKARIETRQTEQIHFFQKLFPNLSLGILGLVILIALNVLVFVHVSKRATDVEYSREQCLETFVSEYGLESEYYSD
ncbi:MAG: hypothetical protein HY800_08000 [Ignavibacteriales bacterium]|nr:hypothetical protein [Ignavibacteriales bacterium]